MSEEARNAKLGSSSSPVKGKGSPAEPSGAGAAAGVFGGLLDLANGTAGKLDALWEEVGYSPETRREHLKGLVEAFGRLCREKVEEEEVVRNQFLVNIEQLEAEVAEITGRLGPAAAAAATSGCSGRASTGGPATTLTDKVEMLDDKVEALRTKRDAQLAVVRGLRERAETLVAKMGSPLDPLFQDETDLSDAQLERMQARWAEVEASGEDRKRVIVQLVSDCQALMRELKWDSSASSFDQQVLGSLAHGQLISLDASPACVGIHESVLQKLSDRANELTAEKVRRAERLKVLGGQIAELWDRLKVPENEREAFSQSVDGLGPDTIAAGEKELARLLDLKVAMLGTLIEDARAQIKAMWDEMSLGEAERQGFGPLAVGKEGYCDDLLVAHEQEVKRLSARLEVVRPILRLIAKRIEILKERDEMEELQKDAKSRLTDRGGKRIEELMRIEKMDKRVKKDLPLLTDKLRKRLVEWERNEHEGNGSAFLFEGVSYLQRMDEEEEAWARYKEAQRMEKEAKKREELERYRLSHGGSIHTPSASASGSAAASSASGPGGAGGNLLPRASIMGAGASANSKTPRKGAAPLSAKKTVPSNNTAADTPSKAGARRPGTTTGSTTSSKTSAAAAPKTPRSGGLSASSLASVGGGSKASCPGSPVSSVVSSATGAAAASAGAAAAGATGEDQENRSTCSAVSAVSSVSSA